MKITRRKQKEYGKPSGFEEWILNMRDIKSSDRPLFFNPTSDVLLDPFSMHNMGQAVSNVMKGIALGMNIVIDGDPDCDGKSSLSELYIYLRNFTDKISYVAKQRSDGHGVVPGLIPKNTDLLIIVDSSTNSFKECEELSKRCDVIVLDHHPKEFENPHALIVNCTFGNYGNPHLSGSGVVYKFCKAMDSLMDTNHADKYIDIAAVGLIGDMMRMDILENRYIVYQGLKMLDSSNGNLGIKTLYNQLLGDKLATSESIAFYIAPCINATIRLGDPKTIVELMICTDKNKVLKLCDQIIATNEERKELTEKIFKYVKSENLISDDKLTIIDMTGSNYSSNIFGLVANKIAQDTGRPCLFGAVTDGVFKGSGRSFGGYDRLKSDCADSDYFEYALGHEPSFGVSFDKSNQDNIIKYFNTKFKDQFEEKEYFYDVKLSEPKLTIELLDKMDKYSVVTGIGFEKIKFLVSNLKVNYYNKIGKKLNHTKLVKIGKFSLNVLKFNTKETLEKYKKSKSITVVGSVGSNRYYSEEKKRLYTSRQIIADLIECNS